MFQYLEKLRKRPERERRKAVLVISLCATLAIALVWTASLYFRIGDADFSFGDGSSGKANDGEMPSLTETFSNFMDQVENIIQNSATYENPKSAETPVQ